MINAAELRPLQNLRHQGPQPEHHLGSARRRRRAELPEYVACAGGPVTIPPHQGYSCWFSSDCRTAVLAGAAQKAILGATSAVRAEFAAGRLIGALARDVFEPRPLHCRQRACRHSRGGTRRACRAAYESHRNSAASLLQAVISQPVTLASSATPPRLPPITGRRSSVTRTTANCWTARFCLFWSTATLTRL